MKHWKNDTIIGLKKSLGFDFDIISSNNFQAHGEIRTRYTVKKPKGEKLHHVIGFPDGSFVVI